ncbi:MAG: hypothetical protein P4M00_07475 [Azospirillaceae bacterium]|nr:hypothetical protein [Azospirillaceae bacterium]
MSVTGASNANSPKYDSETVMQALRSLCQVIAPEVGATTTASVATGPANASDSAAQRGDAEALAALRRLRYLAQHRMRDGASEAQARLMRLLESYQKLLLLGNSAGLAALAKDIAAAAKLVAAYGGADDAAAAAPDSGTAAVTAPDTQATTVAIAATTAEGAAAAAHPDTAAAAVDGEAAQQEGAVSSGSGALTHGGGSSSGQSLLGTALGVVKAIRNRLEAEARAAEAAGDHEKSRHLARQIKESAEAVDTISQAVADLEGATTSFPAAATAAPAGGVNLMT